MVISEQAWIKYINALRKISATAVEKLRIYMDRHEFASAEGREALIQYAHALATKYGEGAGELSCQMYDALAELSGKALPPAEPAETATVRETAKAVNGSLIQSETGHLVPDAIGCLVRRAGIETTLKNAIRDRAWFAWIPRGDTCAFCLTLASRGWRRASKEALNGNHAEHVHAHCDCAYAVSFDPRGQVEGYDPDALRATYDSMPGSTSEEKINAWRRKLYAENSDEINAQKRAAYHQRKETEDLLNI